MTDRGVLGLLGYFNPSTLHSTDLGNSVDPGPPGTIPSNHADMTHSSGMNTTVTSMPSFQAYPASKPFMNDNYSPKSKEPSSFPQNSRSAIKTALENLQDKIRQLENDRVAAEKNVRIIATEASQYRELLEQDQQNQMSSHAIASKYTHELEGQLSSAEIRCNSLEKELEHMRLMVRNSDQNVRKHITGSSIDPPWQDNQGPSVMRTDGTYGASDRLAELEKEHDKLISVQTYSESRINALEDQLLKERNQRQHLLQQKSQTDAGQPVSPITSKPKRTKKVVKKRTNKMLSDVEKSSPRPANVANSECHRHYRVNLAEIPFIAGKSTTPSHSVSANVQKVISLMKSHNLALCSSLPVSPVTSRSPSPDMSDPLIDDLVQQLREEFAQLSLEHGSLITQLDEMTDPAMCRELERDMENLVGRMEAKSRQISSLNSKRFSAEKVKKKRKKPMLRTHSHQPTTSSLAHANGQVEVTTTIKTSGPGAGKVNVRPGSRHEMLLNGGTSTPHQVSLNVLRDMKTLQTTLRKDDLSWD